MLPYISYKVSYMYIHSLLSYFLEKNFDKTIVRYDELKIPDEEDRTILWEKGKVSVSGINGILA